MMIGDLIHGPRGKNARGWATNQAYIALGNLMTAAAVLKIDACPMEGLVPAEYDQILGLEKSGYCTVMACALGYRSPNDKYATLAKVRYEATELVQYI
jgi:nitroreductase